MWSHVISVANQQGPSDMLQCIGCRGPKDDCMSSEVKVQMTPRTLLTVYLSIHMQINLTMEGHGEYKHFPIARRKTTSMALMNTELYLSTKMAV